MQDCTTLKTALEDRFPGCAVSAETQWLKATVPAERWRSICTWLKDEWRYDYLASITAVHYIDRKIMTIVAHLLQIGNGEEPLGCRVQLSAELPDENSQIESVTSVWPAANWLEREVYDMFNVRFTGHPNLTRILMVQDYDGYPLRKDFVDRKPNLGVTASTLQANS